MSVWLGWNATGDLGGLTAYTRRTGRTVWFVKSPPLKPPTYHQRVMRNRFRNIAVAWNALRPAARRSWMRAAHAARLRIGGYALYVWHAIHQDDGPIRTVERLSHETLL